MTPDDERQLQVVLLASAAAINANTEITRALIAAYNLGVEHSNGLIRGFADNLGKDAAATWDPASACIVAADHVATLKLKQESAAAQAEHLAQVTAAQADRLRDLDRRRTGGNS